MLDLDFWILLLRLSIVTLIYLFLLQVVLLFRRDLKRVAEGPPASTAVIPGRFAVLEGGRAGLALGQMIELQPVTTIGRAGNNLITLSDSFISASHAVVSLRGKQWWIEDVGSTNGTFLNRRQIREPTPFEYGDIVEIGPVKLKLVH